MPLGDLPCSACVCHENCKLENVSKDNLLNLRLKFSGPKRCVLRRSSSVCEETKLGWHYRKMMYYWEAGHSFIVCIFWNMFYLIAEKWITWHADSKLITWLLKEFLEEHLEFLWPRWYLPVFSHLPFHLQIFPDFWNCVRYPYSRLQWLKPLKNMLTYRQYLGREVRRKRKEVIWGRSVF